MQPKAPHANCDACPLKDKPIAHTQGPKDSDVILVSRSPGYHEALAGRPFSGPSGQVLDHLLKMQGVERKDIRVTNTVLCAPPEGKVPKEAIEACWPRLNHDIDSASLIIAAGSEAVNGILGRGSIDSFRGYSHARTYNGRPARVVATNNPALVLRDDSTYPNLVKDFKLAFHPKPPPVMPWVAVFNTVDEAKRIISCEFDNPHRGVVAADIESRGGLTQFAEMVTFQFSNDGELAVTFGINVCTNDDWIDNYLKPYLEDKGVEFVWHNGKFDTKILRASYGIDARVDHDTLLLSYALDERKGVHTLDYIVMDELAWPHYEPESVKQFKRTGILTDAESLYLYAGYDAAGCRQVFDIMVARARKDDPKNRDNVWDLYTKHLLLSGRTLCAIEQNGIIYDISAAADIYEQEVLPELIDKEANMQLLADLPLLNPNSPKQLSALVYDHWGIAHNQQSRPDKQTSFDAAAREVIVEGKFTTRLGRQRQDDKHLRKLVIEFTKEHDRYKKLHKLGSTYILGLIERAAQNEHGRVYTDFLLHGTESGRISSRTPNLQNIARDKEGLPSIRRLFKASRNRLIVSADYSQAELRCIAQFSQDRNLLAVYNDRSRSLHKEMAEKFYGKDYTSEQYVFSKNINFGVVYGQSAFAFATMYHKTQREAQDLINTWWETFPDVREWTKQVHESVHKVGTMVNPFDRRRRFYLLTDENRDHAEKEAVNFYAQSTASDFTLVSATRLLRDIDTSRASIAILVHDAIVADVEESYLDEYSAITKQIMESTPKETLGWDIPFVVDIGSGPSWGETK